MATKQAALRSVFRGQLAVAAIVLAFSGAAAGDQAPAQGMSGPGGKTMNLLWLKPNDAKACPAGMTPVTNAKGEVATENGKTKCVAATTNTDREH